MIVFNRTCLVNWLALLTLELSLGRPATESCYVLPAPTDLIGLHQVRNSHPPCNENSPYSVIRAPDKGWCYQFCPGWVGLPGRRPRTPPPNQTLLATILLVTLLSHSSRHSQDHPISFRSPFPLAWEHLTDTVITPDTVLVDFTVLTPTRGKTWYSNFLQLDGHF